MTDSSLPGGVRLDEFGRRTYPSTFGLGLCDLDNLLTPEERAELDRDLAHMAQQRRRAEAEAANVWLA